MKGGVLALKKAKHRILNDMMMIPISLYQIICSPENRIKRVVAFVFFMLPALTLNTVVALAEGESVIPTGQINTVMQNIKNAISAIAMPIGSLCILASVILVGIRIIVMHYNPVGRSAALTSLLWVAVGSLVLGLAILITGGIINISTNNTGRIINDTTTNPTP